MPKRPRAHILEDLSRSKLSEVFSSVGWTVQNLDQDYGEDILVRIFENGEATPWSFFIQLKSTDNIDKYVSRDGKEVQYPIKTDHAQHWERFWEPVILVVFDASSQVSYWGIIQNILEKQQSHQKSFKSFKIKIPTDNILDEEGLRRIFALTKRRFARFQEQEEGALVLIEELKKQWGVEIEYKPHSGLLMLPKGKFVPDEDDEDDQQIVVFGRSASKLNRLSKILGVDTDTVISKAITLGERVMLVLANGAQDEADQFIRERWRNREELEAEIQRHDELSNN